MLGAAHALDAAVQSPVPAATGTIGPRIQFETLAHDFGRMKQGESAAFEYVFTNVGDATLEVPYVRPACGCTTSGEWSRQVEPGQTGTIPIQFNSGTFEGLVTKTVTVSCNDPTQPTVALQLKADIWKPIDINPRFVAMTVTSESPSNATTVRIVSNEETPLTLSAPESSNPAFAAELGTKEPGKEFELIVKTVPPLPSGQVQGVITLKTSSTNLPEIRITAWANVQPVVMVSPSQINLPATAPANPMTSIITIRNNGADALELSDPSINVQGVEVQVQEHQPGRYFSVRVAFPAGFEIAADESVELTLKSNHPKYPVIKVPVVQPQRRVQGAAAGTVVRPASPHVVTPRR
jgi:hypothetical protein